MAVVLSCVVGGGYVGAEDRRPNFLFIIVDDQSPFELQLYNSRSKLATPNIDRLAKQGMVLDGAHQMGSWTGGVCTASRHMIMSGRTLWHCPDEPGRANNPNVSDPKLVPPGLVKWTLPAVFNGAGYDTMRTCKKGNSYEAANSEFTIRRDATRRGGTDETGSAWHAEQVLDYLGMREADGARDPFLIYFGFSHPHDTRDGKQELLEKYGATNHTEKSSPPAVHPLQPALPSNYLPSHPFDFTHQEVRDEVRVRGVWKRRDEATIRNELGRQYACSENIDIQIGRVLERLESIGELENTYVFYTSDHGMAIGRHGLQGKQNLYEHTMRVPMIVRGPGIPAGVRKLGNIYLLDVFSTLCQLAEIETPVTNEGVSFADVLRGKQTTVRDVIYAAYSGGHKPGIRAVRRGDWKLIKYDSASTGSHHTQLFDLSENPLEFLPQHQDDVVAGMTGVKPTARQTNLAFDSRFASKRREMERLLQAEMRRLDDPYELWDQKEAANADHSHSKSDTLPGGASSTSVAGQKDARGVALKDNAAAKHGVADRHSGAKKRVASVKSNSAIETRSPMDAKRKPSGIADPPNVPGLERFAIYESTAPRPEHGDPVSVTLPLRLAPGSRIALVGNGLFERSQWFGNFEGLLHAQYPEHKLIVRHLAWSGDAVAIQPRPANFADTLQHLTREKVDVVFVALGGNESFAGRRGLADFRKELTRSLRDLQSKRFNGHTAAQVVLVSPTACENTVAVPAGDQNNERLEVYVAAMQEVAKELKLGFVDAFHSTRDAMHSTG
ncbi:MAG: sulfatase-like hydrolase/transferase, partial [Planctomycetota bacterium]